MDGTNWVTFVDDETCEVSSVMRVPMEKRAVKYIRIGGAFSNVHLTAFYTENPDQ
jgi:hypothetical protein